MGQQDRSRPTAGSATTASPPPSRPPRAATPTLGHGSDG